LNFAGEVASHFFGLNVSSYQWMIDQEEREREQEEEEERIEGQRAMVMNQKEAMVRTHSCCFGWFVDYQPIPSLFLN